VARDGVPKRAQAVSRAPSGNRRDRTATQDSLNDLINLLPYVTRKSASQGFTLIEIAIVIGSSPSWRHRIVAINPAGSSSWPQQPANQQRERHPERVGERISDNHGTFEGTVAAQSTCPSLAAGTDYAVARARPAPRARSTSPVLARYILAPLGPERAPDRYVLNLDENDRVTVKAPLAEIGVEIEAGAEMVKARPTAGLLPQYEYEL